MTEPDPLLVEHPTDDIVVLRLNRPQVRNALSLPLRQRLAEEALRYGADAKTRAIVITGDDKAFAAGADIAEYRGRREKAFMDFQLAGRKINDRLEAFSKPTIAAVNGYALGGGFEIALCCDMIVVSTTARLGLPEGLLGLSPGGGGTQRLIRSLGRHVTAELLLTAWRMKGERAYDAAMIAVLESAIPSDTGYVRRMVGMRDLKEFMVLEENIVTTDGMLLLAKDSELNENNIYRLIESKQSFDIREPVKVLVPERTVM